MNEKISICKTCGRAWALSELKWKGKPEEESSDCPKCESKKFVIQTLSSKGDSHDKYARE